MVESVGFVGVRGEQRGVVVQVAFDIIENVPFGTGPTARGVVSCVRVVARYQDAPSGDIGVVQVADADGEPGVRHGADRVGRAFVAMETRRTSAPGPFGEVVTQAEHPSEGSRWVGSIA